MDALIRAHQFFVETQSVTLTTDRVPRRIGWRMGATAADVITSVELLIGEYEGARRAIEETMDSFQEMAPGDVVARTGPPIRRVISAFKFAYFSVRAHQDAACGVLYVLLGQQAGRYTSMSDALKKEDNPIRNLVTDRLPGYADWLRAWKDRRDQMKVGAQFALLFDADNNLSIQFEYPCGESHRMDVITQAITLSDVAEGLEFSTRLNGLVHELGGGQRIVGLGPI